MADPSALRAYTEAVDAAVKYVLGTNKGSGFTADDPVRLGPIHKLVAAQVEMFLVSSLFGQQDRQWFDHGRKYHNNGAICEQLVRLALGLQPKPPHAAADRIYSVFFDISQLSDSAPISGEIKQMYSDAAPNIRVPDTAFGSRFPLIEVKGRDAAEAARIISAHLTQAKSQGWEVGSAMALVDDWRNEYELTKANQKTVMRFDMRPSLFGDSRLNLTALTLLAGSSKLEGVIRRFAALQSWPKAFAAEGIKFLDTSTQMTSEQVTRSADLPDIVYDHAKNSLIWNTEALQKYGGHKVRVIGEHSSFEMSRTDLSFLLISAKSTGWRGADDLFTKIRDGIVGLKLQGSRIIVRSDAAGLTKVLTNMCQRLTDTDPNAQYAQLVKDTRQLANVASEGGFQIQLLPPKLPKV